LDDHDPGDEVTHTGVRDPKEPVRALGPDHVLAVLREGHVRHQIDAILETDRDF
jgi:hypothetical protein